jgi:hypothetical protein
LQGKHAGVADMAQVMTLNPSFVRQTQSQAQTQKCLAFQADQIWQRKSWEGLF